MRTTTVAENTSLDGVIQPPASREEARDGFRRGGWRLAGDAATAIAASEADGEGRRGASCARSW